MTLSRIEQLKKEGCSSLNAALIARVEEKQAFYKEAEEQGCSWYEIQMLRNQDDLICELESIRDGIYRLEEKY